MAEVVKRSNLPRMISGNRCSCAGSGMEPTDRQ